MRCLLDTQVYLWFLADSTRLSKKARSLIATADAVYVSAASIWEAAIKRALGKLSAEPEDLVAGIGASGFAELQVTAVHAANVASLPALHRDPFDRLLIAQATHEPLNLLTVDAALQPYSHLVQLV